MSITKDFLSEDSKILNIYIDATKEENSTFHLTFTYQDVANIMNMNNFKRYKMDVEGISGNVVRTHEPLEQQVLTFSYANNEFGSVSCNYLELKKITEDSFSQMCKVQ
ncbi:hypothetical protein [Vibrio coralliirubri]|uniref:hypothetical protein n=1 Tax=Vibrio coralliirubri TaxID=1516159 RepID=UPI00062FA50A|nr:hypothetical protein [Vibrio coralliirubri]CDT85940.1 hypothetical protein VCR8J2_240477 [Vibrio coralliirubri]